MRNDLKNTMLKCAPIVLILSAVILLVLYFIHFNNGFSHNSSDWDAFGSYFGAITGLLAFGGVLWSIIDSNKQNKETSERDTFFKLLDLHTNKFNSVEYKDKSGNVVLASEAFKKYTEEANVYLKQIITYKYILSELDSGKNIEEIENLFYNKYHQVNNIVKDDILKVDKFKDTDTQIKTLRKNIEENEIYITNSVEETVKIALKEKPLSTDELYTYSRIAADAIYHKYGHITGHYFRNLYYAMKITSGFSNDNNYRELLRAQISRYEIAMNLYNALSTRSSVRMINLLNEYEIFDDKYKSDIYLLQILPEGVTLTELLTKSKEYLQSKGRFGR